jgi:hypothetical protein
MWKLWSSAAGRYRSGNEAVGEKSMNDGCGGRDLWMARTFPFLHKVIPLFFF